MNFTAILHALLLKKSKEVHDSYFNVNVRPRSGTCKEQKPFVISAINPLYAAKNADVSLPSMRKVRFTSLSFTLGVVGARYSVPSASGISLDAHSFISAGFNSSAYAPFWSIAPKLERGLLLIVSITYNSRVLLSILSSLSYIALNTLVCFSISDV